MDFAIGFDELVDGLPPGGCCNAELTESEAVIRCHRIGDSVEVSTSYSSGEVRVSYDELRGAVQELARRLTGYLCERHPDLRGNADFLRVVRRIHGHDQTSDGAGFAGAGRGLRRCTRRMPLDGCLRSARWLSGPMVRP